jgi:hypothetical protein
MKAMSNLLLSPPLRIDLCVMSLICNVPSDAMYQEAALRNITAQPTEATSQFE